MSDRAGLLAAIREKPADDFPRRVFADWLDDRGEPERAELIRLQLALADGDESGRGREQEILTAHGQRWLDEELPGYTLRLTHDWVPRAECGTRPLAAFRRGFLSVFFLMTADFMRTGGPYLDVPIARIQLLDRWPYQSFQPEGWGWLCGGSGLPELPNPLFRHVPNPGRLPTAADALVQLSRGCALFAAGRPVPVPNLIYTTGQVATLLGVSRSTVGRWFDADKLRGYRVPFSTDRCIPGEHLLQFMAERGLTPPPDVWPWAGDLESVA